MRPGEMFDPRGFGAREFGGREFGGRAWRGRGGGPRGTRGPFGEGRGEARAAFGPFGPGGFGGPGGGHGGPGGRGGPEGPFGPPPWGPGPRGGRGDWGPWAHRPRGGRSRARRGNVRASLLALLRERPMHGYEMIQRIGELTDGNWRPSPGSVYPTLQLLEDEGLIIGQEEGGKRLFRLTEAGRAEADTGPEAPWDEAGPAPFDRSELLNAKQAVGGLMSALWQVQTGGSARQRRRAMEIVDEARRKLYLLLADAEDSEAEDSEAGVSEAGGSEAEGPDEPEDGVQDA